MTTFLLGRQQDLRACALVAASFLGSISIGIHNSGESCEEKSHGLAFYGAAVATIVTYLQSDCQF